MSAPAETASELVERAVVGRRGVIRLDRGRALNALTLDMVRAIRHALDLFARDPAVEFVTIGSTRPGVFCAGGDIRAVREVSLTGRYAENEAFFSEEFALNHLIATFPKPYLALIDGVCMGGGMGLSIHGRYRVVTDALAMAMPETAIGYVPDVGASYFLNRLPGAIGIYLALTGASLNAADAGYVGLATHCVTADALEGLSSRLDGIGAGEIETVLDQFTSEPAGASDLQEHRGAIDRCFSAASVEEILRRLDGEGTRWAGDTLGILQGRSPNSLRLALKLLHRNRTLPLAECLEIELRLARAITRTPDFIEGVRAVLVDKDRRPRWSDVDVALDELLAP